MPKLEETSDTGRIGALFAVLVAGWVGSLLFSCPAPAEARAAVLLTAKAEESVWPSDRAIRRGVQRALSRDPRLQSGIFVRVNNGEVTLVGLVDSAEAKRAAEEHTINTAGVARVRNLLAVRTMERRGGDDRAIADRVKAALSLTPFVEASRIHVSVNDGMVLLMGNVYSDFERLRAEYAVFPVNGVREVINRLEVMSEPSRKWNDEVQLDLDRELERSAY